jgi:hypothetical protein
MQCTLQLDCSRCCVVPRHTALIIRTRHETVMARLPRTWPGTRPAGGGVVVDGTASAAADRSAQLTTPSWQKRKIGAQRPRVGRWPARPAPPGASRIRARGQGAYRVWRGKEGAVGNQECQESVRRLARDVWSCDARRASGGVWRRHTVSSWRRHTRWARTQGTRSPNRC